jgi:hypothetical protein
MLVWHYHDMSVIVGKKVYNHVAIFAAVNYQVFRIILSLRLAAEYAAVTFLGKDVIKPPGGIQIFLVHADLFLEHGFFEDFLAPGDDFPLVDVGINDYIIAFQDSFPADV